jgi:3-oxoacyl-[acyl-carrier-protein] synthase III
MRRSRILGLGRYLPERVVSNDDLAALMETSDAWIRERSGIRERRYVEPGTITCSQMGAEASRRALDAAGLAPDQIDLIIFATLSPDYFFPGNGVFLQDLLGCGTVGALDIRNQCTGFVYGLSVADQFIRTGTHEHVLVVGAEIQSTGIEHSDRGRDVAVLFGDGAGAAILGPSTDPERGVLDSRLHSEGKHAKELWLEAPCSFIDNRLDPAMLEDGRWYPKMRGRAVFKHAVTRFSEVIGEGLTACGLTRDDIDLLVPHQANQRITEAVGKNLGLAPEQVYSNIERYGNTTAASIPIALSEAHEEGRIGEGDLVLLAAFGSGFTWASAVIRW